MIGNWFGFYKYERQDIQKAVGFEQTYFMISITTFDGKYFSGTVKDDVKTGGMEETGKINGYVKNGKIFFKKNMPRNRQIVDYNGTHQTNDRKHPTLYYSGVFSYDSKQVDGHWKFRLAIAFLFDFLPILYRPGKGSFSMHIMATT